MEEIKKRLINKRYVHKQHDENVLIYNLRRALPVKIGKDTVENKIFPRLKKKDKKIFLDYYIETNTNNGDEYLSFYIMHNIPHIVDVKFVKKVISEGIIKKEDFRTLIKFYFRERNKEHYILKKEITEFDEIQILNIMQERDLQIFDNDHREYISNVLEKIEDYESEDIFFANMYVDKQHVFFFEHPIEHVPAMMMIEASRQFLIAICHMFGKIPLKGENFILSDMKVYFNKYLELNYPIKMILRVNKVKKRKDRSWRSSINATVTFYQHNIKASSIEYNGRIITNNQFKKIRENNFNYVDQPRFNPSGMFYSNLSIRDSKDNKFLCKIIDISINGFQLEFEHELFTALDEVFEFFIFFQEIGFVHGKCELKWYREYSKEEDYSIYRGGFEILEISKSDKHNFKEAIKLFCYLKTEREYL